MFVVVLSVKLAARYKEYMDNKREIKLIQTPLKFSHFLPYASRSGYTNFISSHLQVTAYLKLDTYRDIRAYLESWQRSSPRLLDPIRNFENELSEDDLATRRHGNMFNGRDPGDSAWDTSKLTRQDEVDASRDHNGESLEPGDMVALLTTEGVFGLAIYVRSIQKQRQFYTNRGNWRLCSPGEIDLVLKRFVDPGLLEPIKPYFPTKRPTLDSEIQAVAEGGLPRPLGARILERMRDFERGIFDFYRNNAFILDNIYDRVADDTELQRMTLEELTMRCLGVEEEELDNVMLFSVHRAVRGAPFLIEKDRSTLFSDAYTIQPKRTAKIIEQVSEWSREHADHLVRSVFKKSDYVTGDHDLINMLQGKRVSKMSDHPMQQFVQKAQRLIQLSRKVRSPTVMSSVGPSHQRYQPDQDGKSMVYREVLTEKFNETDRKIIEFLQLYSIPSNIMSSGQHRSAAAHIMRATGMYTTLGLSEASARLFLQELGVIAPWENMSLLDQTLLLPGHGVSIADDLRWEEVEERCQTISETWTDSMQHLRKDWGDLPVYCVDDVTAQEIDDGFSLERIPGSDDTFWIHIHVANPTAYIGHNDPIIEYAGSRLETLYAPERTYPIFPNALTQEHFSLKKGRPTLTFSAKMNFEGEISETSITNGRIHNVISLTHGDLRRFLNPDAKVSADVLEVGGKIPEPTLSAEKEFRKELAPEDKETFTTLRQLLLGFRNQRRKNGAMEMPFPRSRPSVAIQLGSKPPKPYEMEVSQGRYFVGDPIIQLRMEDHDPHYVPDDSKNDLVMLLMTLAGNISGKFCAARNIPAVYNGTWFDPEYEPAKPDNLNRVGGKGFYEVAMPNATASSTPIPHHMLGFDAYIKSTSPLRRFNDVIAHYQIEAALRFEAEHGRPFDANTDAPDELNPNALPDAENVSATSSPLPYTKSDLDAHISSSGPLRARLRDVSNYSAQHWACLLLFRAFYFAECELPASFSVLVRAPRSVPRREGLVYNGIITNLGVACSVKIPDDCPGRDEIDVSSIVKARITGVDMADVEVKMEATKFVKGFERTGSGLKMPDLFQNSGSLYSMLYIIT
ncbi:hypothetical protein N7468_006200 [Penicillium chermesinum]|uniref:RNB domain-containing protein n=1 Tax=Penicillium chermesinum TaxID=63820 RepID=A0A9W9TKX2_9EURO|nr:uncharacterized protein N7468_006200 [Penicillium chermesinum]KAJ5224975.1 hypothetical protein N7468_006200 [Penicillium chermesinum]